MTGAGDSAEVSAVDQAGSLEKLAREIADLDEVDSASDVKTTTLAQRLILSEQYSGSFPHPALLKQFDEVVDNGAERAFQLTEREQKHRHDCDLKLVDAEVTAIRGLGIDRRLVIILAFLFLFTSMTFSAVLVSKGHSAGAGIFGGISVLTTIGAIFAATRAGKRDDKKA
jgi:uncharacterized membrane protein